MGIEKRYLFSLSPLQQFWNINQEQDVQTECGGVILEVKPSLNNSLQADSHVSFAGKTQMADQKQLCQLMHSRNDMKYIMKLSV